MNNPDKDSLLILCERFVDDNKISCAESINQVDSIIVNAYDFIEKICDIVGYYEYGEDE